MRKLIFLSFAFLLLLFHPVKAQEMEEALKTTFADFQDSTSFTEKVNFSNRLGLIANKWDDQWITHYYSAYSLIILSYQEKEENKKDAYLDAAEKQLEKAKLLLKTDNDELFVLTAMLANARLAVKPMSRWQKYGAEFNENINKAKSLQPNNPRIYFLNGMSSYHTPKMFGGGAKVALPYFEKADSLFQKENKESIMKPNWGNKENKEILDKCKTELKA